MKIVKKENAICNVKETSFGCLAMFSDSCRKDLEGEFALKIEGTRNDRIRKE